MTGTLLDLDAFVRAVDGGSFSAAARQLGVTPSAVSRAVARLEADFRVALACAAPAYLAARGTPGSPADLRAHDCLGFLRDGRPGDWIFGPAGAITLVPPAGPLHSSDAAVLLEAARAGLGIVWVLDFIAAPLLRRGELVSILDDHAHHVRPIHALVPPHRHLLPKVRAILDFVAGLLARRARRRPRAYPRSFASALPGFGPFASRTTRR